MEERLLDSEAKEISDLRGRFLEESKKLWKIALPAMVSRVTLFGTYVITQAFIGHIGRLELAAYAVIQITAIRFAHGILLGMTSAIDTLGGQAFGAKQYHMMGIYLQRSLIINVAAATLVLPAFIFSTPILRLLGEDEDIAKAAGYISLWFIPIVYFLAFHMSIQKYLQAQLKNAIIGWVSTISFLLHVLLSWILVSKLNLGIPGAMWAMIASTWLILIGEVAYVIGGWCPDTWKGFTLAAFSDLFPVLKLSISSGLMLCLELWYNAVLVLMAGYMKNATTEISAFSICLNVTAWDFMLCVGFLAGISVRVANELGRGNAEAAKFSIKVTLTTSISIGFFLSVLCLAFGHQLANLFTTEKEVAETVSSLSILLALSVLLNSIQTIFSGIAVGAGRQGIVAYVNIGCYYVIGVPLGVFLAYEVHLQVKGIWIGMIIGVVMQSLVLGYITWRTDWDEQVQRASHRLTQLFSGNSKD
ncbi:multidrug resistance pump, putative [Ricinus communis]|uniref:Protein DETOXIFICATION n=1 Tax=Ricinus communis TaxID=3988 RepID=B9SY91_RICCO|nr:multidrug resistance pump, putative [Ricinus communis]|eukprot:XP_002530960.1 protein DETOXIFICATION 24 [Ricinus communis]